MEGMRLHRLGRRHTSGGKGVEESNVDASVALLASWTALKAICYLAVVLPLAFDISTPGSASSERDHWTGFYTWRYIEVKTARLHPTGSHVILASTAANARIPG